MLFVTSALSLGLGRHALPALQVGDLFWLALLLASGAFATLALTGSRSRPIAAGAKVAPCLALAILAGLGYGHRSEIGDFARRSWLDRARPCAAVAQSPDGGYRIDAM